MSDQRRRFSANTFARLMDLIADGRLDVEDDTGPTMRKAARRRREAGISVPDPFLDAYNQAKPVAGFRRGGRLHSHPFIVGLEVSEEGDIQYHQRELQPRQIVFADTGQTLDVVLIDRPPIQVQTDIEGAPISLVMKAVPVPLLVMETFAGLGEEPIHPNDRRLRAWRTIASGFRDDGASSTPLDSA